MIFSNATPAAIGEAFGVSRESLAKLQSYVDLLLRWQRKINLIGPSTAKTIWHRHIADGIQLVLRLDEDCAELNIVDLGSGAGIPGLVLALARPEWTLHLVESNSKKAAFLRETSRLLGAENVVIHAVRVEHLSIPKNIDWVVSRAMAPLPLLLHNAQHLLKTAKGLFHKGQDVEAELTAATRYWSMEYVIHPSIVDTQGSLIEVRKLRSKDEPANRAITIRT